MKRQEAGVEAMGLKALRESRKEIVERVRSRVKEQNRLGKQIAGALKDGPKTVPEISREAGLPIEAVLWILMALKKYGKITEEQQKDSYFTYGLKEE
jgi:predicted transcriptional regulator